MKRSIMYGVLLLLSAMMVSAVDCTKNETWQARIVDASQMKACIVSSDAVLASEGGYSAAMYSSRPTCKARQPTMNELLNFERYYTYKLEDVGGVVCKVQTGKKSDQVRAYDFTDAFANGDGLYCDLNHPYVRSAVYQIREACETTPAVFDEYGVEVMPEVTTCQNVTVQV